MVWIVAAVMLYDVSGESVLFVGSGAAGVVGVCKVWLGGGWCCGVGCWGCWFWLCVWCVVV